MAILGPYYCTECKEYKPVEAQDNVVDDRFVSFYCSSCGTGPLRTIKKEVLAVSNFDGNTFIHDLLENVEPELFMGDHSIYLLNGKYVIINHRTWEYVDIRHSLQLAVTVTLNVLLKRND